MNAVKRAMELVQQARIELTWYGPGTPEYVVWHILVAATEALEHCKQEQPKEAA